VYRIVIKTATWLACVGGFAYLTYLLAAASDGAGGVVFPIEFQLLALALLIFLGVLAGCARIVEVGSQRQQAAMLEHLSRHRRTAKAEIGEFLKDEVTVWIARSDAHSRGRLVDELTEILGTRIDMALRTATSKAYHAGLNQGYAKGFAARASVPHQDVPHVLGSNVLHMTRPNREE
jgi:hypothetical protein